MDNKTKVVLIFLIILIGNASSLIHDFLHHDDKGMYFQAISNLEVTAGIGRTLITPQLNYFFGELSTISIGFARFIVIILMAISAFILHYFYVERFKLNENIAFFAAVLPFIVPGQYLVPTFVMGSYPVRVLVMVLLTAYYLHLVLKSGKLLHPLYAILGIVFIYLSTYSSTNPFIFIPIIFFFILDKDRRSVLALIVAVFAIALLRVGSILNNPLKTQKVNVYSVDVIIERSIESINFVSPVLLENGFINLILGIILVLGSTFLLFYFTIRDKKLTNNPRVHLFALAWLALNLVPFLFSTFFTSRYLLVFGIGYNLLICMFIGFIIDRLAPKYAERLTIVILASVVILCVGYKNIYVENKFAPEIKTQQFIEEMIQGTDFPENAQLIIAFDEQPEISTGARWRFSSGTIQHMIDRTDITGIIGRELHLYNPFQIDNRYWKRTHVMNGLNIELPVFCYYTHAGKTQQVEYILQYGISKTKNWKLYEIDQISGQLSEVQKGFGKKEIEDFLEEQDIDYKNVYGIK